MSEEQNKTPLVDAIAQYIGRSAASFAIPAHKGGRGADVRLRELLGDQFFLADLTETQGLDDLHAPEGAIREAQTLAAALYGSKSAYFVVNGTTAANEAMLLATLGAGEKVLLQRNAHKSAFMGLVLSGAEPIWMLPSYVDGIAGAPSPEMVADALDADPAIKAVFLVSPNYYGIAASLRAIADICHARGVLLLVDEAHGAHLRFCDRKSFPEDAVTAGADLVAQSAHKGIGSLTQSSLLHINSERVDRARVEDALKLVQSTSPSYLLMASLDAARHLMATKGPALMREAYELALFARERIKEIPGLRLFEAPYADPTKLVFSARDAGISGHALQEQLFSRDVMTEFADDRFVVALLSFANTREDARRLAAALKEIIPAGSACERIIGNPTKAEIPKMRVTPREAYFSATESLLLEAAEGRIAGEMIAAYPPGIPLLYPGELITEEILAEILKLRRDGCHVHGPADDTLSAIRVLKEKTS